MILTNHEKSSINKYGTFQILNKDLISIVTIHDVARHAKVSKSTVSLVIQNSPLVKESTRKTVLASIQALGYVPNVNARGLQARRTNNIGIVILSENSLTESYDFDCEMHLYQNDILNGIPSVIDGSKYGMLIEQFTISSGEGRLPQCIESNRIDGVIILGGFFNNDFAERLTEKKLPVVVIGGNWHLFDTVITDHYASASMMMQKMIETGHKRICFLDCPVSYSSSTKHREAYEDALKQYREKIVESWILNTEHNSGASAMTAFKSLWDQGARPDAVIGANGMIILGAVRFLSERGVRLPDQVSLVVHEDSFMTSYAYPPISAINVHKELMGQTGAKMLFEQLNHEREERKHVVMSISYIDRGSIIDRR